MRQWVLVKFTGKKKFRGKGKVGKKRVLVVHGCGRGDRCKDGPRKVQKRGEKGAESLDRMDSLEHPKYGPRGI